MHGGVPNKEFNENNNQCSLDKKLSSILNDLGIDRSLLDDPGNIEHMISLLEGGADRDTQNRYRKTLSHHLDKRLSDILGCLASDRGKLNDYIRFIIPLLRAGADPNTKGQDGKTPLDYSNEELLNILNQLAIDSNLLDNPNSTQYIMLLLEVGANQNVRNQAGKTLLHYVAERNDIEGIKYFLGVIKANPSIRDHSGKTPFKYVTEHKCLQVIKDLGYDLDDAHENEGNPTTPNGSVDDCSNSSGDDSQIESVKLSDCNTEEDSDCYSDDSRENEESLAKSPNNDNRTPTDQQTSSERPVVSDRNSEGEDSSCSSSDYLFLEDSLLAKLEIPLTTDEQKLIDKFCEEIRGITAQNKQESEESILKSIEKIVDEYLEEGIRLNSSCSNDNDNGKTIANLIFEEMEGVIHHLYPGPLRCNPDDYDDPEKGDGKERQALDTIIKEITSSLVLKGGKEKKLFYHNRLTCNHYEDTYLCNLNKECKEIKDKLKSIACEGIVNKSKQTHEYDFKAEIDNVYFYVKYPQDSIIEPAKVLNHEKAKKLNLKVGILQIGESIVRVESIDGKRNYKDILKGRIKMSFTTEVGEISVYLSPSKKDGNKIKIEIDEENKAKFNKLKDKSSLGKNCLLEEENVSEVISKNFKMSDSVSTESIETIKDVPFTDFTQAYLQQINTIAKG